ncbi:putative glutathione S-transferase [Cucumis melo var. makuwa]|uniref:Glutathione S-transferase n=1 Tax=Cucumis melo var. makuwa TaxID=1194695 RepID=A0A5D3CU79_CUCMM|nr:putative glutathione S-transferase [Cucumis melo var. makuwa]TYK13956.1 putative glutathione S-transferase [Cucumis melo var. makuwa]
MDVKTAFLNGDSEEEIYMEQPEGFIVHGQESKVCKLDKSLYGLKQAPKQWHEKFDNLLMSKGFKVNESDKCIYYKIEEKILKKYNYFESKLTCTPYDSSVKLFKNTDDGVNQSKYASIIGSLRYANCTRLDIAYAIGLLSIAKVLNCYYNGKRRQICRKHNTIREFLTTGAMIVDYLQSDYNLADPLTKRLAKEKAPKFWKGGGDRQMRICLHLHMCATVGRAWRGEER